MRVLAGLGLSFTALSPLIIGGIISSIAPALFAICLICTKDPIEKKDLQISLMCCVTIALASVAIGVGLAAATTAIFPGAR